MKKKVKSPEELTQLRLNNELAELRNERFCNIPEPTIQWKVGDRVQRGNIDKSIIEKIIDNGKIYLLNESGNTHNYGKEIPYDNYRTYSAWMDLVNYKTVEENDSVPQLFNQEDIRLNFSQRNMSSIFDMAYHFGIDFNPFYQREFCWYNYVAFWKIWHIILSRYCH